MNISRPLLVLIPIHFNLKYHQMEKTSPAFFMSFRYRIIPVLIEIMLMMKSIDSFTSIILFQTFAHVSNKHLYFLCRIIWHIGFIVCTTHHGYINISINYTINTNNQQLFLWLPFTQLNLCTSRWLFVHHFSCGLHIGVCKLPLIKHWYNFCFIVVPFYIVVVYTYYHGILDHSGVNFKSFWWQPWQPDAIFHDNHHQYFHVNFGFNIQIWDKVLQMNELWWTVSVPMCIFSVAWDVQKKRSHLYWRYFLRQREGLKRSERNRT